METNKETRVRLGKMIADARTSKGISQSKLAEMVGTQSQTICKVENGKWSPSVDLMDAIVEPLGIRLTFERMPE